MLGGVWARNLVVSFAALADRERWVYDSVDDDDEEMMGRDIR